MASLVEFLLYFYGEKKDFFYFYLLFSLLKAIPLNKNVASIRIPLRI